MTYHEDALTHEQANAVYDVLIAHADARADDDSRAYFVRQQTRTFLPEFRYLPALGHGGKFRRNNGYRTDGSWGETWYVDAYPEDIAQVPTRQTMIDATNAALADLQAREG